MESSSQLSPSDLSRVRFFSSLDGLRALSILGILWAHVWYVSGTDYFQELLPIPADGFFWHWMSDAFEDWTFRGAEARLSEHRELRRVFGACQYARLHDAVPFFAESG